MNVHNVVVFNIGGDERRMKSGRDSGSENEVENETINWNRKVVTLTSALTTMVQIHSNVKYSHIYPSPWGYFLRGTFG